MLYIKPLNGYLKYRGATTIVTGEQHLATRLCYYFEVSSDKILISSFIFMRSTAQNAIKLKDQAYL